VEWTGAGNVVFPTRPAGTSDDTPANTQFVTLAVAQAIASVATLSPTLLTTILASNNTTVSDTTHITASYAAYDVVLENIVPSITNSTLELQVHSGGAFKTTNYLGATLSVTSGASGIANATAFVQISRAAAVEASGVSGTVRIYNPSNGPTTTLVAGQLTHADGAVYCCVLTSGAWNSTGVVDGFQIQFNTGVISTGSLQIIGIP
jgi:hypothetical protein